MDREYRKLYVSACILIALCVAFFIFLSVISEVFRAIFISLAVLIAAAVLAIWIWFKKF